MSDYILRKSINDRKNIFDNSPGDILNSLKEDIKNIYTLFESLEKRVTDIEIIIGEWETKKADMRDVMDLFEAQADFSEISN